MKTHEVVITKQATDILHQTINDLQSVSLLSADKVRSKFFHKFHQIQHDPLQSSKVVELQGMQGHFRVTTVLNHKIYFKVEEEKIIVLDILLENLPTQKG
jgi:hypothetical protein